MAAAAADAEADGLPIIRRQSTTTTMTTTSTAEAKILSVAHRLGYVIGSACGKLLAVLILLVLLIVGVVVVWYLCIGVAHFFTGIAHLINPTYDPVEYTVTITAVSGLELDPGAQQDVLPHSALIWRLDPAFNLTLGVSSPTTAAGRECVKAGTTVEVSYLRSGVPLASGPAPTFCVDVGERREVGSIVAWGDGVRLPRFVLDTLAADVRRGSPEFGVKLTPAPISSSRRPMMMFWSNNVDVISCWAKAGGGPAQCRRVSGETVSFPPLPRPGRERDFLVEANNLPRPTQERISDA